MDLQKLTSAGLAGVFRSAYRLRQAEARVRDRLGRSDTAQDGRARADAARACGRANRGASRRRNILFITVDQQRYDALGVNGGLVARTPCLDALAREGINYRRAHVQNVVCMPSRSTMLTGQHPRTHGVITNGIALPEDAPNVAAHLREAAGYRTALIGKAHFEPHLDLTLRWPENRMSAEGSTGPWRGFDRVELATHGPASGHHYAAWLWEHHREDIGGFAAVLSGAGGGETHAPEVCHNPIPRAHYHTDWVADRTLAWLDTLPRDDPWFCWMSFPDPHHPFDPPHEEVRKRIPDWRDVPLPVGYPGSREVAERILAGRPRHWLDWYQGRFRNPEGGPTAFVPGQLTSDQLREMSAMIHVENELIDEACGRVMSWLRQQGLDEWTDVFYTSDHGDLQGDYGLMFKGPYHTESLLRIPLIWRPASAAGILPSEISEPVGHVDLAPTFCEVAGVESPRAMEGTCLPRDVEARRERVITTFDSQFAAVGMHLRTIYADGMLCTAYEARDPGSGGRFPLFWSVWGKGSQVPTYLGSEGELYDVREDPQQWENRWDDPSKRAARDALLEELYEHLPPLRDPPLKVAAPT